MAGNPNCLSGLCAEWFKTSWRKKLSPFTHQSQGGEGGIRDRPVSAERVTTRRLSRKIFTAIRWLTLGVIISYRRLKQHAASMFPTRLPMTNSGYFFSLLEMLGFWKAIQVAATFDLFNVADSQTAVLILGLVGWSEHGARWNCRLNCRMGCLSMFKSTLESDLSFRIKRFFIRGRCHLSEDIAHVCVFYKFPFWKCGWSLISGSIGNLVRDCGFITLLPTANDGDLQISSPRPTSLKLWKLLGC